MFKLINSKSMLLVISFFMGLVMVAQSQLTWQTNNPLPSIKRNNVLVNQGNVVYSIGGRPSYDGSATRASKDIYRGVADSNGTFSWVTEANILPGDRSEHAAAIIGNRLYVWGGWDDTFATLDNCWYSNFNGDSSVGTWTVSSVTIPAQGGQPYADSFGRNILSFNSTLYVINGENNSAILQDVVLYSRLSSNGDYTNWATATDPGDPPTWWHGVAIYTGSTATWIYKIGGSSGSNAFSPSSNSTYRALINADGSLSAWTLLPTFMPQTRVDFGVVQVTNKILVIGGSNDPGFTASSAVFIGSIDSTNGDITWAQDSGYLPGGRVRVCATSYTTPLAISPIGPASVTIGGSIQLTANGGKVYACLAGGAAGTGASASLSSVFTADLSSIYPQPTLSWSLDTVAYGNLSASTGSQVLFNATSNGTTIITLTSPDLPSFQATVTVVSTPTAAPLVIEKSEIKVYRSEDIELNLKN